MFSELLRIKPVLDTATATQMEQSLSRRFARVAHRFRVGLQSVIKGTVLGISLGLLAKLLNPLNELEEKVKKLLGEGKDLTELADRFGTTPGELKRLQDVSRSIGVSPEHFQDMLTKYAEAVEKAREELKNTKPGAERSESTQIVREFVGEKDLARGFFQFIQSLKTVGFTGDKGMQARLRAERGVFGSEQHGAARHFIEADFDREFKSLGGPDVATLNDAIIKSSYLEGVRRKLQVQGETRDFLATTRRLSEGLVKEMQMAENRRNDRETKQLESFKDLQRAAQGIEELKGLIQGLSTMLTKGLGELVLQLQKLSQSPLFKFGAGIFGKGGK